MRTGAEYREALHDGRRVWVLGEGLVEDVTSHPATRAVVDEYAAWYDRHFDPAWQEIVLTPLDERGGARPGAMSYQRALRISAGWGVAFQRRPFSAPAT
jgi:4-hydroxyphenylacetate 3-monooxygenase